MTQIDAHSRSPAFDRTPLTVQQREAIARILRLNEHRAETEATLERTQRAERASAERRLSERVARHEEQYRAQRSAAEDEYAARRAQIISDSEARTRRAQREHEAERFRIDERAEHDEHAARKNFEEAKWTAETVFEARFPQPGEKFRQAVAGLKGRAAALKRLLNDAEALLRRKRVARPEADRLSDPASTQRPDESSGQSAHAEDETEDGPENLPPADDPFTVLDELMDRAEAQARRLRRSFFARLLDGLGPFLIILLPLIAAAALLGVRTQWRFDAPDQFRLYGIAAGGAAIALLILFYLLARRQLQHRYLPLAKTVAEARRMREACLQRAADIRAETEAKLRQQRDEEIRKAQENYEPQLTRIRDLREKIVRELDQRHEKSVRSIDVARENALQRVDETHRAAMERLETEYRAEHERLERERAERLAELDAQIDQAWRELEMQWKEGMSASFHIISAIRHLDAERFADWGDDAWGVWNPPADYPPAIRFGEMELDLAALPGGVPEDSRLIEHLPAAKFTMPAMIDFPWNTSLLFETAERDGDRAVAALQNVMMRLLTSLPAGKVRFTIIDPVGLGQNFAGFMHLADYGEHFVADRIWTETRHIEQRLADLTEHMENVIQKYLRNDFETITEYNIHAGEIAEPFRFLVIANFPVNFSETAARRLVSIVDSGKRCGVYTLISMDTRHQMPQGFQPDDLRKRSGAHLVSMQDGPVRWNDDVFGRLPLSLDAPPSAEFMTQILRVIGETARDASRVEVPFEHVIPPPEKLWSFKADRDVVVPLGRAGATKLQSLSLGRGMAQHVLIAGKTGSGKSTLLHVLITNLALRYRPDEVEFYLVDFKKGVEFKTYATHNLPHARAVAIESDREFGLSVLQRVDGELKRRGELFRKLGVQDLAGYRELTRAASEASPPGPLPEREASGPHRPESGVHDEPIPRTLLIIDEFQEFFVEDDRIAQEAALLLDRLVRQGRAFGIHVLLGSQTLGGAYSLARATIGQMAVRVALQCSESDAMLIMGDDNTAPRLLSRPGEAIYNDQGGLMEGNNPFQIVWLPDRTREEHLAVVERLVDEHAYQPPEQQIVFEGNMPADIRRNQPLSRALRGASGQAAEAIKTPRLWIGEAIAIKDPTAAVFRRQSGTNLLIVGQRDEFALAMHANGLIALAAQTPVDTARFYVFDSTPEDSPLSGRLEAIADLLPHDIRIVTWHDVEQAIAEIGAELDRRQSGNITDSPPLFTFIHGIQRLRQLRVQDEFGFGSIDDAGKPKSPDKHLTEVLRDGPPFGMHAIVWCDNANNLARTFDRNTLREFDQRIMFQMSATDSSTLIDTPIASTLGENRAFYFSEDRGVLEKFRPYALPEMSWVKEAARMIETR